MDWLQEQVINVGVTAFVSVWVSWLASKVFYRQREELEMKKLSIEVSEAEERQRERKSADVRVRWDGQASGVLTNLGPSVAREVEVAVVEGAMDISRDEFPATLGPGGHLRFGAMRDLSVVDGTMIAVTWNDDTGTPKRRSFPARP